MCYACNADIYMWCMQSVYIVVDCYWCVQYIRMCLVWCTLVCVFFLIYMWCGVYLVVDCYVFDIWCVQYIRIRLECCT